MEQNKKDIITKELKYFLSYLYLKHPFYNSLINSLAPNGIELIDFNTTYKKEQGKNQYIQEEVDILIQKPKILISKIKNERKILIDINFSINYLFDNENIIDKNKKIFFYFIIREILHTILKHNIKFNNIKNNIRNNKKLWYLSGNIVIDNMLRNDNILKDIIYIPKIKLNIKDTNNQILFLPNKVFQKKCINNNIEYTIEEIYDILLDEKIGITDNDTSEYENIIKEEEKQNKKQKIKNKENSINDNKKDCKNNDINSIEKENFIKKNSENSNKNKQKIDNSNDDINEIIIKALEFEKQTKSFLQKEKNKNYGNLPGYLAEEINSLLLPKTNLKAYLNKIITAKMKKETISYKRPDRRYLYNNLIVPSKQKTKKHFNLLFFIDTSGSMQLKDLQQSISDIINVFNAMQSNKQTFNIDIVYSDTDIQKIISINSENYKGNNIDISKLLEIKGRGGTELFPLFSKKCLDLFSNTLNIEDFFDNYNYYGNKEKLKEYLTNKQGTNINILENKIKEKLKYDAVIVNTDFYISEIELAIYKKLLQLDNNPLLNFSNVLSLIPKNYNKEFINELKSIGKDKNLFFL